MFWVEIFGYFLTFQLVYSLPKKNSLDNYFKVCRRNDPRLGLCIQKSINNGLPHILNGIPEIKLPPLEPLFLGQLNMTEGSGNLKLKIVLSDAYMSGYRGMTVENFKIDLSREPHVTIKTDLKVPYAYVKGKYLLAGKILVIPVQGRGDFYINATHYPRNICTMKGQIKLNPKDGKQYLTIDSFDVFIDVKKGRTHFSNLFNGNKVLGIAVNKYFNDNFYEIFNSLRHLPQRAFGQSFKDYVNHFFKSYPFDELLLPDD